MNEIVTIDLESVRLPQADKLLENIRPASNLKDPAKIEASIAEKRQKASEEFALHWWTAKVVAISAVSDTHQPQCWYGEDEIKVLTAFGEYLLANPSVNLCGKSVADFDVPFLCGRYMTHSLGVPAQLRTVDVSRIRDVDHIFGFSHAAGQRTSLSNYAFGLQIPGKLGKGNDVAGWYAMAELGDNSQWENIAKYCIQDSMIAHEILARYRKPFSTKADNDIINPPF
jgi:hypothetical protein